MKLTNYEQAELELIELDVNDVIATSTEETDLEEESNEEQKLY